MVNTLTGLTGTLAMQAATTLGAGDALDDVLWALAIAGLLATLAGMLWNVWIVLRSDVAWGLSTILTLCVPFLWMIVYRTEKSQVRPVVLMLTGLIVFALAGYVATSREKLRLHEPPSAEGASEPRPAPRPVGYVEPPPPMAPVPEMTGKPVDLSSVMGRAQKLANSWRAEAALVSIEATMLSQGVIRTESGGTAKLIFGPGPFGAPMAKPTSFVVIYDQAGLHGAPDAARPGKSLPEPMCAPETALARAAPSTTRLALRYARDASDRPAWLVSDPAAPSAKPRGFDAQSCAPLSN